MKVLEEDGIIAYIKKRNLVKPYLKLKRYLENDFFELVDLRKRKPKSANVFYLKLIKNIEPLDILKTTPLLLRKFLIISSQFFVFFKNQNFY